MFRQSISPNPNVACRPGWCLEYVRKTFGLGIVHPTAIAAWNASAKKHRDWNFPAGVWVPVWFTVKGVPAGHVALRAPDGSVYSSTTPNSNVPRKHPNMADLLAVYAGAGIPLTFLGWTEDVQGTQVVQWSPAAAVATRTVTNKVAYARTAPRSNASLAPGYPEGIAKGANIAVVGYVAGEDPYGKGDNAWYKTRSGYFIWANAAGNNLAGLSLV